MSGITFCAYSTSSVFRHILAAIWKVLSLKPESALWLVPCRNEDKTQTRVMGLRWHKPDLPNVVLRGQCKEGVSSQGSGSPVNPVIEYNRKRVSLAAGNWVVLFQIPKLENSQVYRQENVNLDSRKLGQKGLTWPKSEEDSPSTGQPVAVSPEMENMKFSNYPYVEKIFQCVQKKMGRTSINSTFLVDSYKKQYIGMTNVHDIVDEGSHPPWARFLGEFGNLQEYKIREHRDKFKITQKVDEETFWRNSECEDTGISITLMD